MPVWLQTYSGRMVDLLRPTVDDVLLVNIAHALGNICRFTGHCFFYSVAEHSVRVSQIVSPENALYGLLHDGAESLLGDVSSPLKAYLNSRYSRLERDWMKVICEKFDLPPECPEEVLIADKILLLTEVRDLMIKSDHDWGYHHLTPLPYKIIPWGPRQAKEAFIEEYTKISTRGAA